MSKKQREFYYKWQAEAYWESMCRYQKALSDIYESSISKKRYRLTKAQILKIAFEALYPLKTT